MSKSDSLSRPPKNPWSTVFAVAVIVAVLVFAFLVFQSSRKNRDLERKTSDAGAGDTERRTFDSFAELLAKGSADELRQASEQAIIRPDGVLAVKLEAIDKRLRIADRLMEMTSDPDAYRYGLKSKVSVLALAYTLDRTNHLGDETLRKQFEEYAQKAIDDEDPSVQLEGHVSMALVLTHDFLKEPDAGSDTFEKLVEHYTAALQRADNDAEKAHNLYTIAVLVRGAERTPQAVQLFRLVYEAFKDSTNPVVHKVSENAYDQYVFTEYDLAPLILKIQDGDRQAMEDFRQRIQKMVEDRKLTDKGFERLFAMLEAVMQTGQIEEALSLMKFIRDTIPAAATVENREATEQKIDQMIRRAEMYGRVMDLNGLVDVDGRPMDPKIFDGRATVLLYWAPNNQYAVRRVGELFNFANAYQDKPVRFLAVYPEYQPNEEVDEDIREFVKQAKILTFAKAQAATDSGKAFLEQFPIPFVPYILVLDGNQQVRGINPSPDKITELLNQAVASIERVNQIDSPEDPATGGGNESGDGDSTSNDADN